MIGLPPTKPEGIYTTGEMLALIREMWRVMPAQDGTCAEPERWRECLDRLKPGRTP